MWLIKVMEHPQKIIIQILTTILTTQIIIVKIKVYNTGNKIPCSCS